MIQKNILIFLFMMCWNFGVLSQNYPQLDALYAPKLTGASFVEKRYHESDLKMWKFVNLKINIPLKLPMNSLIQVNHTGPLAY